MHTMTENILRWDCGGENAESIEEYLNAGSDRGRIKRLIIMPGGSAAFASWGKENAFVKQLSEENPGMLLTHLWMNEGKGTCGNYHWQDGRIVADDTPTSETELAGLIQKIKQEIVRAEEHDLDDFSQDDLGMR